MRSDVKQSVNIFKRNVRQIRHWLEEESAYAVAKGPRRMHCVMDAILASTIEPGGVAPTQTEFLRNVDFFPSLSFSDQNQYLDL